MSFLQQQQPGIFQARSSKHTFFSEGNIGRYTAAAVVVHNMHGNVYEKLLVSTSVKRFSVSRMNELLD